MNLQKIYLWLTSYSLNISYLFKNRLFFISIKNIKNIFSMLGFYYKNNNWHVEKLNNLLNFLTLNKILFYLFNVLSAYICIFYFNILEYHWFNIFELVDIFDTFIGIGYYIGQWIIEIINTICKKIFGIDIVQFVYRQYIAITTKFYKFLVYIKLASIWLKKQVLFVNIKYSLNLNYIFKYTYNTYILKEINKTLNKKITQITHFIIPENPNSHKYVYNLNAKNQTTLKLSVNQLSLKKNNSNFLENNWELNIRSKKFEKWMSTYVGNNKTNYLFLYNLHNKLNMISKDNTYNLKFNLNGINKFNQSIDPTLINLKSLQDLMQILPLSTKYDILKFTKNSNFKEFENLVTNASLITQKIRLQKYNKLYTISESKTGYFNKNNQSNDQVKCFINIKNYNNLSVNCDLIYWNKFKIKNLDQIKYFFFFK